MIKLITNGGENLTCKKFIEESRKIIKSNFVYLVFSKSADHLKWITKMPNVLFTNDANEFRKYITLKMCNKDIIDFAHSLESKYKIKFLIDESQLLKFPII